MAYEYPAGSLIPVRGFTPQLGEGIFVAEDVGQHDEVIAFLQRCAKRTPRRRP